MLVPAVVPVLEVKHLLRAGLLLSDAEPVSPDIAQPDVEAVGHQEVAKAVLVDEEVRRAG